MGVSEGRISDQLGQTDLRWTLHSGNGRFGGVRFVCVPARNTRIGLAEIPQAHHYPAASHSNAARGRWDSEEFRPSTTWFLPWHYSLAGRPPADKYRCRSSRRITLFDAVLGRVSTRMRSWMRNMELSLLTSAC